MCPLVPRFTSPFQGRRSQGRWVWPLVEVWVASMDLQAMLASLEFGLAVGSPEGAASQPCAPFVSDMSRDRAVVSKTDGFQEGWVAVIEVIWALSRPGFWLEWIFSLMSLLSHQDHRAPTDENLR